jgi:hypothetical protein
MRRLKSVIGALALVVASFAAFSGPATAQYNDEPPFEDPPFEDVSLSPYCDEESEYYDEELCEDLQEAEEEYQEAIMEVYEAYGYGYY